MCVDMTTCICAHVCMIYSYNYIYSKLFIQFYQYIRKYNDNKNNKNNNNNNNSNVYIYVHASVNILSISTRTIETV